MLSIKNVLKVTVLSVSLFSLVGCGDSSCCGGPAIVESANVAIGEKGVVATAAPAGYGDIAPTAAITINNEDVELAKLTPCTNNTFSAISSNDPDGENGNLTYQWTGLNDEDLGTAVNFDKKFCDKGLYEVSLLVTDEQNLTGKDSVCFLVGLDAMPLVLKSMENQTISVGESVTLSADVLCQDDTGFEYKWTDCGREASTEATFSTSNLPVGEHTFKVTVKDAQGHCTSSFVKVTVTP